MEEIDFQYLMREVDAGRVKKPWRKMKRRTFKKFGSSVMDEDDLFILATNAQPGDIFHEHEQNHRIDKIDMNDGWQSARVCGWGLRDRRLKRGQIKRTGYIDTEPGSCICGCGPLSTPVSAETAAKMEVAGCACIFDLDRFRKLEKELRRFTTEKQLLLDYSHQEHVRDDPNFALYVTWAQRTVRKYDEEGHLTIVDADGVLLPSYKATKKDIWDMCWAINDGCGPV